MTAAALLIQEKNKLERRIWNLAVPAVGANLLHTTLFIIDTMMIASFRPGDSVLLAASAIASAVIFRMHGLVGCIAAGTTALVARAVGQGDSERAARTVAQSILMASFAGIALTVAGISGAGFFLRVMQAEQPVVEAGMPYLTAIFFASVPRLLFGVSAAALQGAGDTRSPMFISLYMNFINVFLNWLLIYGHWGFPRLGLTGSGIATSIAILFSAVAVFRVMLRGRSHFHLRPAHFVPDRKIMGSILSVSWPTFLEESLISLGLLPFTAFIMRYGNDVVAAQTIVARAESLSLMVGSGFAIAAGTLVGQSLGAGNAGLARFAFRRATAYSVLLMSVAGLLMAIFGKTMVGWFVPADQESISELARALLLITVLEQPLLAFVITIAGGLRGAGDTLSPMVVSFTGNVITRFLICGAAWHFGWGIVGIYLGVVLDWVIRCLMLWAVYRHGRWSRIQLA